LSDAAAQAGLAGTRGTVDPARAKQSMMGLRASLGYALTGPPVAIWGGRVELPGPSDGTGMSAGVAVVVAAPMVDGGWAGEADLHLDPRPGPTASVGLVGFTSPTDPGDPTALLALRFGPPRVSADGSQVSYDGAATSILAVAPTGAVTVRSVLNGQTVDQAAVTDGGTFARRA